jgi:hypothetical protein
MTTAVVAGILGVVGTLLGSVTAFWGARVSAERADRRALGLVARGEYRSAVVQFASAALAYQQAAMDRWLSRRGSGTPPEEAAQVVHRMRTAAWHALFELELSTEDQDLARAGQTIVERIRSIEEPEEEMQMSQRAIEVRQELAEFVRKARSHLQQG